MEELAYYCKLCHDPLPPQQGPGRRKQYCNDKCRINALLERKNLLQGLDDKTFAAKLQEFRKETGLSQNELGRAVGLSSKSGAISLYEENRRQPERTIREALERFIEDVEQQFQLIRDDSAAMQQLLFNHIEMNDVEMNDARMTIDRHRLICEEALRRGIKAACSPGRGKTHEEGENE